MILICFFLMMNDAEDPFMSLRVIYIISPIFDYVYVQIFSPFLLGCFLIIEFRVLLDAASTSFITWVICK